MRISLCRARAYVFSLVASTKQLPPAGSISNLFSIT